MTTWLRDIEVDNYDLTNDQLALRLIEAGHDPLTVDFFTAPQDEGDHYLISDVEVSYLTEIEVDYADHLYADWVLDRVKEALVARGWANPTYRVTYQETGAPFRYEWYGQRTEALV